MRRLVPTALVLALAAVPATAAAKPGDNTVTATAGASQVVFGKATTISGQVTGPGNAGVQVTLDGTPAPFTNPFKPVAAPASTDAAGAYSFTVTPQQSTRYRVAAKTKPTTNSPEVTVLVALRVSMRVGDRTPRKGQRVRFRGTVTPAHDGSTAQLQRRGGSGWKTVATRKLVAATPLNGVARSKYAFRVKVRRTGTYRVLAASGDVDHVNGTSRRLRLRVH
jgi:hypothetical protein